MVKNCRGIPYLASFKGMKGSPSIIEVEASALKFGLHLAILNNYLPLLLETNNSSLVDLVNKKNKVSAEGWSYSLKTFLDYA